MIVYRFMSNEEYNKFKNGEILENHKDFRNYLTAIAENKKIQTSNSVGFCFFDFNDYHPLSAYSFVSGVVSSDVCVIFKTDKKLNESFGVYYPNGCDNEPYGVEYCTETYSKNEFEILASCLIPSDHYIDSNWKWQINNTDNIIIGYDLNLDNLSYNNQKSR